MHGAYNLGAVEWTREIKSGSTPTAGMGLTMDTGADGEDEYVTCPDKDPNCFALAELHRGLVDDQTSAYTAGDEIPALPFPLNIGSILQNINCVDPGGNVNAISALSPSSGTAGKFKPVTEATLASNTGTNYGFQTSTLGTNAAAGAFILPRTPMRQLYYKADPNAAYATIGMIWGA